MYYSSLSSQSLHITWNKELQPVVLDEPNQYEKVYVAITRQVLASWFENKYLTIAYLLCLSVITYLVTYIQNHAYVSMDKQTAFYFSIFAPKLTFYLA